MGVDMSASFHSPTADALVLSAGGMFAAWQAGAWKALAEWFAPGLVVGTSAGALNGWAIAGGCAPEELIGQWLDPSAAASLRLAVQAPWRGVFDAALLERSVRRIHARYSPRVPFGAVTVELPRLRPCLFRTPEVDWRHLLASCSVPFGLPPVRIAGRWHCDGGLISPLPVWAAAAMGARRIVALNALPLMPSRIVRGFVKSLRKIAGTPAHPRSIEVRVIAPPAPLGRLRDLLFWDRDNVRRWIELGERDAKTISLAGCFGGQ
jgi:predicted acylesterase/phospholipase RssA